MEPQILRRVIRMDEQGERSGCIKRADEQVAEQTEPAAIANDETSVKDAVLSTCDSAHRAMSPAIRRSHGRNSQS
jgi:hypothetical protein